MHGHWLLLTNFNKINRSINNLNNSCLVTLILLNYRTMKTPILKPGFEFIFALSLIAILGLPPMLMAQDQKDVEIKIMNGDTTINGKNIKDLSPGERKNALRDIRHLSGDDVMINNGGKHKVFVFRRRDSTMAVSGDQHKMITGTVIIRDDSTGNAVYMRPGRRMKGNPPMRDNPDGAPDGPIWRGRTGRPPLREPMMGFGAKNSQTFNYVNTDNDGISTRITFQISDVSNDDLKRMPHVEGPRLEVSDLNLVPQFSTGKTMLIFSLPGKAPVEVKLVNSEGKILWTEKSTGTSFIKSFVLGLNGTYYLQVKQGSGVAVKRILKEE
jgi:hypothetical protein